MSKAFTRESDVESEAPLRPLGAELPPGVPNYMTPEGAARLREEHDRFLHADRARLAGDAAALRDLDRRLAFLARRLEALEIVAPAPPGTEQVLFGATVTVRDSREEERRYRIVGVDEADPPRGLLGFRSPIAAALLGARRGEVVVVRSPRGDEELEIVDIRYDTST